MSHHWRDNCSPRLEHSAPAETALTQRHADAIYSCAHSVAPAVMYLYVSSETFHSAPQKLAMFQFPGMT